MNSEHEHDHLIKSNLRDDESEDLCYQLCKQVQETKFTQHIIRTITSGITFFGLILYFYFQEQEGCIGMISTIRIFCLIFMVILIARFPIGLYLNLIKWKMASINKIIKYHNILNFVELLTIVTFTIVLSYFAIMNVGKCDQLISKILLYLVLAYLGLFIYGIYAYFMKMNEKEESQC